ncbi:MAG: InlB B-repeat-containing protein, partial [Alphaproteobacteria bacterium]|nr:InlB B-repeat-containing protein [Alphaproteobacteria bacterium]
MLGIFKHIKYAICAIFVFCAVALSSNFAFAGYVCPAQTVTYSSCKSGYYMTYKGVYNGTPQAGNLCSACPDGYTCSGGTAAPTITCAAGTRVVTAGAKCTTPSGGWWTPASHTVTYGQVSTVNYCMAGWTNTDSNRLAHISGSYCRKSVAAGNRTINTISARYIKVTTGGNTLNEYSQVVEIQAFASNDGTGTNLLSGKGGISGTNLTNATDGSWARAQYASGAMIWDMGSIKSIGSIKFALYTDGRTYSDVTIAVSTNNSTWTTVLGPIDIATQNVTTATGELVRLKSVLPCTAGTYSDSDSIVGLTGSKLCAACAIGSYASGTGNTGCTACQNGTTTTATGQSSCNAACSNAIGVTEFYPDVVWNTDNTLTRLCDNYQYCDEGYYISRDGVWADDSDESLVDNEGWFLAGTVCSTCPDDAAHCPGRVKSPVYPVTFNFQGGTADFSTMYTSQDSTCSFYLQYSYTSGSCITKLEVPTRTGYTFKGYYTAASGGTQVASADGTMLAAINTAVPKNAPSTLYAQWTVNTSAMQADLYFRCEDGSYAKKADGSNAIFTSGYACEDLEQSFICDGKYVTGWDDDLENVGGLPNSEVCDFVTYAIDTYGANTGINFTAKSYGDGVTSTVTLNNNGGTGGTSSVNATYGSAMPSATMPMRPGYMFSGYYDTNEETGGTSY